MRESAYIHGTHPEEIPVKASSFRAYTIYEHANVTHHLPTCLRGTFYS